MGYFSPRVRACLLAVCSAILISCASSSDEIASSYVSPTQYSSFNCDQLSLELARLNARKTELAGNLDKAASNDESLTAVSIILFWPAAFALGGNEAQEAEYARLKGEYDAVQQMGIEKNCNLDPNKKGVSPLVKNYGTGAPDSESVYEYYGQAEDELNSGNMDKNLWARALVEAEGDETKRKAKYIELRANQLYYENTGIRVSANLNENINEQIVPSENPLTGTYTSTYTGKDLKKSPDFRNKNLQVKLVQDGKKITGTFGSKGKVWGDVIDEEGGAEVFGVLTKRMWEEK